MSEEPNNGATTALVPTGLADDQLLAVAAAAERRIDAVNKIKTIAMKVTNQRDWSDQGGNPYLQVSGSEKVGRLFGISWRLDEPTRDEHDDGHFSYTFKGYFSMGTAEIEVIGTRSSRDPFFSGRKDDSIPPSEIDRNDVKKSAMTNCIGNGVTRLLGIRNLTWDDLATAGIQRDQVGKVHFHSADPHASPTLPNYGKYKGQPMNDPAIPIEELKYYLSGAEKSFADPAKAKYKTQNAKMRDALKAEIATRTRPSASVPAAPVAPAAPSAHPESAPGPVTGSAAGSEVEAAWLSQVLDCEEVLRGTTQGTGTLRAIRAGFKLQDGAYPLLPVQQEEYRVTLVKVVERMQRR